MKVFLIAMESFAVDKSFYDIATAEELRELWDTDMDPVSVFLMPKNLPAFAELYSMIRYGDVSVF